MSSIRSRKWDIPKLFVYPEWEDYVYYPRGSIAGIEVTYGPKAKRVFDYYIASVDIPPSTNPLYPNSAPQYDGRWKPFIIFSDSESNWDDHDSDILYLKEADSDIRVRLDALEFWRDSDHPTAKRVLERTDQISDVSGDQFWGPSTISVTPRYYADTGILTQYNQGLVWVENRTTGTVYIVENGQRIDSDNPVLDTNLNIFTVNSYGKSSFRIGGNVVGMFFDNTTDPNPSADIWFYAVRKIPTTYKAVEFFETDLTQAHSILNATVIEMDSDIYSYRLQLAKIERNLDSEYRQRNDADSDLRVLVDSEVHDRKEADSDIYLRLDSEYHWRKAGDSDLHVRIDSEMKWIDSEINLLKETDSDQWIVIKNLDSDFNNGHLSTVRYRPKVYGLLTSNYVDTDRFILNQNVVPYDLGGLLTNAKPGDTITIDGSGDNLTMAHRLDGAIVDGYRMLIVVDGYVRLNRTFLSSPQGEPKFYLDEKTNADYYDIYGVSTDFVNVGAIQLFRSINPLFDLNYDSEYASDTEKNMLLSDTIQNLYWNLSLKITQAGFVYKIDYDSDMRDVDSDIHALYAWDSEHDSDHRMEVHDRKAGDSDLNVRVDSEIHDRKAADSDLQVQITDNDSDIQWLYDRDSDFTTAVDSDIRALRSSDSDMKIVIKDNDSEIRRMLDSERHDRMSMDSDFNVRITDNDSDIQWLYDRDSDFTTAVDSDILALKSSDSDMKIVIADNDSEIRRMLDSERHERKSTDSDLQVQITDNDSDILWLYDRDSDFTTAIDSDIRALKSTDSDQWVAIKDNDSDIAWLRNRIVEMEDEEDSDNAITRADHDSDLLQTYHDFKNGDSDLQTQITDNDSDIQWLYDRDSDFTTAIDSDILSLKSSDSDMKIVIKDNDSEINRRLDSEIHDRKSADSDFDVRITDNDSDIQWLYDRDSDFTSAIDSDILALRSSDSDMKIVIRDNDSEINRRLDSERHDRKSADSDFNVRITDNDSDIQWLYDRDSDFTTSVDSDIRALKATDSDQWHRIREIDSDIATLFRRTDSDERQLQWLLTELSRRADSDIKEKLRDDSELRDMLRKIIDSDYHIFDSDINALREADSEYRHNNDSDHHSLFAADSDIRVSIVKEIHDRRAGDSDLQVQVTDNDSDIQWLYDRDSDFTTAIDSDIRALKAMDSDQWIVIKDNDSEIRRMLDSEIHDRKSVDSEIFLRLDSEYRARKDGDSDIMFGNYHAVRIASSVQGYTSGPFDIFYDTATDTYTVSNPSFGWGYSPMGDVIITTIFGLIQTVVRRPSDDKTFTIGTSTFTRNDTPVGQGRYFVDGVDTGTVVDVYDYEVYQPTYTGYYKLNGAVDSELSLREYLSTTTETIQQMLHMSAYADSDLNKRLVELEDASGRLVKYNADSDIEVRGIFFNNDSEGYLKWNPTDFTLDLHVNSEVTLQLGQEQTIFVKNRSGRDMPNGTVVRLDGVSGSEFVVNFANNDSEYGSHSTLGVTTQFIGNNNGGFVTFVGKVRGLNTSAFTEGDALWLDSDGGWTNVKPLSPKHLVFVGYVERSHANDGIIYVKVQNGYELEEIHDVLITNVPQQNHNKVLMFDSDTNLWKNQSISTDYGTF